ncbi:hypothetical protein [Cryobacterium sp. MLB-32]|uniref:hypothetical protein n=1 Tax=Cryobacterium sp. MLB-32 TaxID=1529318 RepID=UPI00055FEC75|nr:hypothetical protein [Cryobacterium sp. MLB-32]
MKRWLRPPTTESLTQAISAERTRRSAARWTDLTMANWPDVARGTPSGPLAPEADTESAEDEAPFPLA